jgi:hypothetical protein
VTTIRTAEGRGSAVKSSRGEARWHTQTAREPALALLVAALGVTLVIAGNALPSQYYGDSAELTSQVGIFAPLWKAGTWLALPLLLMPPAVIAVLVLAARARVRPLASGALIGLGLEGYLMAVPLLAMYLSAGASNAALAWVLVVLGSVFVVTGGALLYARSEDGTGPLHDRLFGLGIWAAVLAAAGALTVALGAVLPVYDDGSGGGVSLLGQDGAARWLALEPLGIAAATLFLVVFVARDRCREVSAGALVGLGALGAMSFLSVVLLTSEGDLSAKAGSIVGLAGTLAILAAGAVSLVSAFAQNVSLAPPPPPADAAVKDERRRETTRRLAAAAHLETDYASGVVRSVLNERHRAVAPSFGVDLALVLRHCLAARGRHTALRVMVCALVLPLVLAVANRGTGILVAALIALATWVAIFVQTWVGRYRVGARHLSAANYEPTFATRFLPPGGERRVRNVAAAESGNIVVYSGYSPYVGSGYNHGGWSFAVNVSKGRQDLGGRRATPKPFTTESLYAYATERLERLGMDDLHISDRLYVDGELIRDDTRFLPQRFGRPRAQLTADEMDTASEAPTDVARRVHCISVEGWSGEIVFTTFLSFVLKGSSLYAQATYCVLAPPDARYRAIDGTDPHPAVGVRLRHVGAAFVDTLKLPLQALRAKEVLQASWSAWRSRGRDRREIARNPRFDYGARTSIRELAQGGYRRHFQAHDRDMFGKIVEREILDAILTFLELHNVDTTELEERGAAVLNNGVIVTGGQVKAESLAVGSKAQAKTSLAQRTRQVAAAAKAK